MVRSTCRNGIGGDHSAEIHAHCVHDAGPYVVLRKQPVCRCPCWSRRFRGASRKRLKPGSFEPQAPPARRKLAHDLGNVRAFRQKAQARRLLTPNSGIGVVFGVNDAGENDRKLPLAKKANSGAAAAIASRMLPPPNTCGSAKPLTKSTTSNDGRLPNPVLLPKCCVR